MTTQTGADIVRLRHGPSKDIRLIRGFISYAHDDYWALKRLLVHLKALEKAFAGKIKFWADTRIRAGDYWTSAIESAIRDADLHLLLVSAQFLASDYIGDTELPAINSRYAEGALVVPIVLRGCIWEPFVGPLHAVPTAKGRVLPICDWSPQENGFHVASTQISDAIQAHFSMAIGSRMEWRRT